MAYRVSIMPRAQRDLEAIFAYIQVESSLPASRWFNGLAAAIETLTEHPQRNPRIPEDSNLHHLLYGHRQHIYRIIYSIDLTAQQVNILHIRHHARKPFHPEASE
jgi:toxin ParE1/3/4